MPRSLIVILLLALAMLAPAAAVAAPPGATAATAAPEAASAAVPLISRGALFGNPSRSAARLSPDGQWLSWVAPRDGVLNVWVAPVGAPDRARPLSNERERPIRTTWWSPDSRTILFVNDRDGNENFLLYGVDVASGKSRAFTPFDGARVKILATSSRVKTRILLGVSQRDPHWQDVFSLDLATGALSRVFRNDRYDTFVADADLRVRVAQQTRDDGSVDWFRVDGEAVDDVPLAHADIDDALTTAPLQFSADGKTLWCLDSRAGDTVSLVAQDMATGRTRVAARDARADVDGGLFDPATGALQAWGLDVLTSAYVPSDPAVAPDLDAITAAAAGGQFKIISRSDDDQRWLVTIDRVTAPLSTWLYERRTRRLTPLFVGRPALAGAPLVAMQPVTITARDGLELPSYLSLPANASGPVPMVLLVHGGPWERDTYGYNATHQWLANRGYAVLSVNFRGSTGFGKRFVAAGDRQWGGAMQDDLLDAVAWAVAHGVTTRDRVAIMGSSYGGYATLVGLSFTPTTFACGVDIVGPSSLPTTLEAIPPHWESFRAQFYRRVGDPTTADGLAMLNERSPLNRADRIARPLLIGQGANDPRVGERESDQIVAAMKSHSIPVSYVVFPDEGHGFVRPANRLAFLAVAENFLQRCLGGRAEAIGDAMRSSSAEIRDGAEFTPGLRDAVAAVPTSTSTTCVVIRVATGDAVAADQAVAGAGGSANQARASSTSAAMPTCSASSDP